MVEELDSRQRDVFRAIVVEHLLERPAVDDRLAALEARTLLALESFNRQRAELDPFDCAPGLRATLEQTHAVEAGALEGRQETLLSESP